MPDIKLRQIRYMTEYIYIQSVFRIVILKIAIRIQRLEKKHTSDPEFKISQSKLSWIVDCRYNTDPANLKKITIRIQIQRPKNHSPQSSGFATLH